MSGGAPGRNLPRRLGGGAPRARSCEDRSVITEHAILDVRPGEEHEFEAAFAEAAPIIAGMPGFESLHLHRCIESPSRYLLIVAWRRLEDHTEGFRGSAGYEEWRRLLHRFYDPFPLVEHYRLVAVA
jgi:heme-degrading monooxygenase HmoA